MTWNMTGSSRNYDNTLCDFQETEVIIKLPWGMRPGEIGMENAKLVNPALIRSFPCCDEIPDRKAIEEGFILSHRLRMQFMVGTVWLRTPRRLGGGVRGSSVGATQDIQ